MKKIVNIQSLMSLAVKTHQEGQLLEAQKIYSKVLASDATNVQALTNLGSISFQLAEYQFSLKFYEAALRIEPKHVDALYNQARAFHEMKEWGLAISGYGKCLKQSPSHKECLENLASLQLDLGDYDAGLIAARSLVRIAQNHRSLRLLGQCLIGQGHYQQGYKIYEKAVSNSPARPEILFINSISNLRKGNFELGWRHFYLRWSAQSFLIDNKPKAIPVKRWSGESLADKHLFLSAEQGIGDEVMYASCLADLQELAASITLECDLRLVEIYKRSFPGITCIPLLDFDSSAQIAWIEFDYTCSIGDLPQYLRLSRDAYKVRPWLAPQPDLVGHWSDRLKDLPGLKIGISWFGGSKERDKVKRSIELDQLVKAFDAIEVSLISLQYSPSLEEISAVNDVSKTSVSIMQGLDCRNDIDSLISLISCLDLVVTIDNATAHLAGSVGAPVWSLLPLASDWRWLENEFSSYWYKNMRLFRNKRGKSWDALLVDLSLALGTYKPEVASAPQITQKKTEDSTAELSSDTPLTGEKILLLNDTLNWYHWGCSCTSLAIYRNLIAKGYQVSSCAISDLMDIKVFPNTPEQFDDQELLDRFVTENPSLMERIQESDRIVINGEGTLHNTNKAALLLLYLAYIAKQALGKNVQIINHSCFPDDQEEVQDSAKISIYRKVYECLDFIAVRDQYSYGNCRAMGITPTLSFDCLPLFLQDSYPEFDAIAAENRISFGASALSDGRYLKFILELLKDRTLSKLYQFDFIVGARAYLASDDVEFVDKISSLYPSRFNVVFCNSEGEWLRQIRKSKLLISGRFHYSIAAACLGTPFLLFSSNTPKNVALMARLDDYPGNLLSKSEDPYPMVLDALDNPQKYRISGHLRNEMEQAAEKNFYGS